MEARRKLFGTDGVRGRAGDLLTAELATGLGRAATAECEPARPQVLIVRDTRESGPMLESALAAGVAEAGGDAFVAGVLPTPAASVLLRRHGFDLAAVISASHNPYQDNGIKFFGRTGTKLDDETEERIERRLEEAPGGAEIGRVRELNAAAEDYLRELQTAFPIDLQGARVTLDCAHGATYRVAPAVFERLGADVDVVCTEPDGRNINAGCGSTAIENLVGAVESTGSDVGFAFDGDGDRVMAVDRKGNVRDGDELIALSATRLAGEDRLRGGVAVTVMTNYGFHQAMEKAGIDVAVTKVGDRYVLRELQERDWLLGGEQSGHIIWMDYAPTGDGIAAALITLQSLDGADLSEVSPMARLPQRLENVEVSDRDAAGSDPELERAIASENAALEGRGRVLVRPSGTEPVVRVMVEAPTAEECETVLHRVAALVRERLG